MKKVTPLNGFQVLKFVQKFEQLGRNIYTFGIKLTHTFLLILLTIMVSVVDVNRLIWDNNRVIHRVESKQVIDFAIKNCWGFYFLNAAGKTLTFLVKFDNYNFRSSEEYATHSFPLKSGPRCCILILKLKFHIAQLHFIFYDWFSFHLSTEEKECSTFFLVFFFWRLYPAWIDTSAFLCCTIEYNWILRALEELK